MTVSLGGWDLAYAIRLPELNARLGELVSPIRMETRLGSRRIAATITQWKIVPGGAGKLLRASLSLIDGELYDPTGPSETFSGTANLTIELDAVPHDVAGGEAHVRLKMVPPQADDVVFVNSFRISNGSRAIAPDILVGLRQWFDDHPETIEHVIATVYLAENAKTDLEEWLRPTSVSYAYSDARHPQDCILAVLGMTGDRAFENLDQQISHDIVPQNANSAILISSRLFLDTVVRRSLPESFPGTAIDDFEVSETDQRVRLKAPRVLNMTVDTAEGPLQPLMTFAEISIRDNMLISRAHCQITRQDVFTAYAEHSCSHQLVLINEGQGGSTILFSVKEPPISKNWMEVTPEHKHKGEIMSYAVYGLGAAAALITGGVGGIVVGLVSSALGQLCEKSGDLAEYLNTIKAPALNLLGLHLAAPCLWAGDQILHARDIELSDVLRLSGDLGRL